MLIAKRMCSSNIDSKYKNIRDGTEYLNIRKSAEYSNSISVSEYSAVFFNYRNV